jgi:hypothetical protein
MEEIVEKAAFAEVCFRGEDSMWDPLKYDRLAVGASGALMFISLIGPTAIVAGIRAYLNTNKKVTILASGADIKRASAPSHHRRNPGNVARVAEGYRTEFHKVDYGAAHAVFITKSPGFLLSTEEEAIWQELNTDRFTTPLLRGWMPWLMKALTRSKLLVEAECYRCKCGELTCTTSDLDALVGAGIKEGHLKFEEVAA